MSKSLRWVRLGVVAGAVPGLSLATSGLAGAANPGFQGPSQGGTLITGGVVPNDLPGGCPQSFQYDYDHTGATSPKVAAGVGDSCPSLYIGRPSKRDDFEGWSISGVGGGYFPGSNGWIWTQPGYGFLTLETASGYPWAEYDQSGPGGVIATTAY